MNNKNSSAGGVSILTVVGVVFIILKLANLVDWSWWVVLIPFWFQLAFIFLMLFSIFIGCVCAAILRGR